MKTLKTLKVSALSGAIALACAAPTFAADSITEALTGGKASGFFRLRYEAVDQDNALKDADAMTLLSRIAYTTDAYEGFSATIGFEDVRVVGGLDDYSVPPTGFKTGQYSVIADPETTELDQGFLQYKNDMVTAKLGRQVIALGNQRFVGHVGWRQDRQTFDGLSVALTPADNVKVFYAFVDERNRIFSTDGDIDSKDHMLNIDFKTSVGTLTGYAYLLDNEGNDTQLDTYGVRFAGATKMDSTKLLYEAEYATQSTDGGATDYDADYYHVAAGAVISGITAKVGYEVLGSDDGAYGFSTPLATLHKFNGWADIFLGTPATGLEDLYVMAGTKVGPGMLKAFYHDFSANEGGADYGSEVDVVYAMKFAKHYNAGIKYAKYSADDRAVDTDKLWIWVGAKF